MKKQSQKKEYGRPSELQTRLFRMVSVGVIDEPLNRAYDVISITALIANLTASICNTYDSLTASYGGLFSAVESVTVLFFAIDFILRLVTSSSLYPDRSPAQAMRSYVFSAAGIIDFLSFMPYYLPFFFPSGLAAFRIFRVVRILRLFRINAYYDQLSVITEVLSKKKQQLTASVFIIATLIVASSLCMYSLEHNAQPEVFSNAFSGIWWAASTLLTVGYGDIYPVTTLGKCFGILITFLGVGLVAVPTGIISAGFVEQYQELQKAGDYDSKSNLRYVQTVLKKNDDWTGRRIRELHLPYGLLIAAVRRGSELIPPRGDLVLSAGDLLTLCSKDENHRNAVELREVVIGKDHSWNGLAVGEIDISRKTWVVLIRRSGTLLIPRDDVVLKAGDTVLLYKEVLIRD
ncbi:MAG: ion transporter [Lachnospiraceae bacterium]|nr:ion transporter [Lachnospiraceae bacterium]